MREHKGERKKEQGKGQDGERREGAGKCPCQGPEAA